MEGENETEVGESAAMIGESTAMMGESHAVLGESLGHEAGLGQLREGVSLVSVSCWSLSPRARTSFWRSLPRPCRSGDVLVGL